MELGFFWDTEYTIPAGAGFRYYCLGHLLWLGAALCLGLFIYWSSRRWEARQKLISHRVIAVLLAVDELFKYYIAWRSGEFHPSVLPLHLCSINIFLIAADAFRPNDTLRELLYAVCLPGAAFALVFPGWNYLPLANGLCIHSFTAHILLLIYPLQLLAEGFIPRVRRLMRALPAVLAVVGAVYLLNLRLGTNFMFLMRAGEGNPLSWLESFLGNPGYLVGLPLIAACCWAIEYGLLARLVFTDAANGEKH